MRRIAANLFSGIVILLLNSCDGPPTRFVSERDVTGKWFLAELETQRGNRGPAAGAIFGDMELKDDGSYSARLQWKKGVTGKEEAITVFSGTWSLSNGFLISKLSPNARPTMSKVWIDNTFLALEPQSKPKMIYYYKKIE